MSLKLPNDKIVYNLPEQVGVNTENIKYLAEVYKEIDSIPAQYAELKADYEDNIKSYFDNTMKPTFTTWTNTFNGWTLQLETYLASMSSAAVGAIAGQDIAPANIAAIGNITGASIIENMNGYSAGKVETNFITFTYVSAVKNGNKLTLAIAGKINVPTGSIYNEYITMGAISFTIPTSVGTKIYPAGAGGNAGALSSKIIMSFYNYAKKTGINCLCSKQDNRTISITFYGTNDSIDKDVNYAFRWEETFLLTDNLLS